MNELDPAIAAAARKMNDSIDRLVEARLRLERTPIDSFDEPRPISDGVMFSIAELPNASQELKRYAERVRNGECFWSERCTDSHIAGDDWCRWDRVRGGEEDGNPLPPVDTRQSGAPATTARSGQCRRVH